MGILKVLSKVGKAVLKGLDVAGDVLDHPAVVPLTLVVPWGWLSAAIVIVKKVDKMADEMEETFRDETGLGVTNEEKRRLFAEEFRKQYPEASDGDIQALAMLAVKIGKGDIQESPPES